MKLAMRLMSCCGALLACSALASAAQEKSVRPGINKPFENPDLKDFLKKFEGESREIAAHSKEIVAACKLKAGMAVADVGAGTGLFTRKFASAVGPGGKVYAVDIAPTFLRHIEKTCRENNLKNVETVLCDQFSTKLPKNSVELVFICDTYHHFEFPQRTMQSIHDALRPEGQVVLIDFQRIEGKSSDWVLGHVRAGKEVFVREITSAGFRVVGEESFLKENYFVRFEKVAKGKDSKKALRTLNHFQQTLDKTFTPARAVTLVEKGQARAAIILPERPSPVAEGAARVLRDHIKQMSGAELSIRTEDQITGSPTQDQAWVLIGEGRLTEKLGLSSKGLGPGGIVLSAQRHVLALFGTDARTPSDPHGTRYAVTTFLEDKLGVRYLWPGELGKVVPRRETITVADFQHRYAPKLAQRRIRSMGYHDRIQVGLDRLGFTKADYERLLADAQRTQVESPDWFGWHRLGGTLNLSAGHAFVHLWAKYGKEHPDWFALQPDGSRDQSNNPDRARLCVSNPDLIAAIAKEKTEELNKNPNLLGVSIAPNDGGRPAFCTCPKCEALDSAKGRKVLLWDFSKGTRRDFEHVSLTDRMVYFWNAVAERVAKAHPDKLLVVDAYSVYAAPPVERKLHPNLIVRFAPLDYHAEDYRQESLREWDGWSKAAKRIYFRPNLMLAGRRDGMPLLYVHKFGKDFRYLASHGMMGTDFDACCHNWATQGLNYYVVARLHWNPEQDVSVIVNDYCRAGFGPAAESVRRYFDGLEALMDEAATKKAKPTTIFHPKALGRLRKELEQARRDAGSDPAIADRLAFLELGLRWTEIEVRAHTFLSDPAQADKEAVKKTLDERFALMRRAFRETPLALNAAYISWGEDALWSRLGWERPRTGRKP